MNNSLMKELHARAVLGEEIPQEHYDKYEKWLVKKMRRQISLIKLKEWAMRHENVLGYILLYSTWSMFFFVGVYCGLPKDDPNKIPCVILWFITAFISFITYYFFSLTIKTKGSPAAGQEENT